MDQASDNCTQTNESVANCYTDLDCAVTGQKCCLDGCANSICADAFTGTFPHEE